MDGDEGSSSSRTADDFTRILFSWSLEDIYNENLYKNQVEKIPDRFDSIMQYLGYFLYPLMEDTRAAICSSMEEIDKLPYAEITELYLNPEGEDLYDVKVEQWRNRFSDCGKKPYITLPGDLLILVDAKPGIVSDLRRASCRWTFASVTEIEDADNGGRDLTASPLGFKVNMMKWIGWAPGMIKKFFAIFLVNLTTNKRIWNALHMSKNCNILEKVLSSDSLDKKVCEQCLGLCAGVCNDNPDKSLFEDLNESQVNAIFACFSKTKCLHQPVIELIWGPPGTGKTKTASRVIFNLFKRKLRCLVCAPTNVAVKEVASRVLHLFRCHSTATYGEEAPFCALGDVLLFGSNGRLKADDPDLEKINLDYRVKRLAECIAPVTGWQYHITSMVDFLEDSVSQYHLFLENESTKRNCESNDASKSFLQFSRQRFRSIALPLQSCLSNICTHISSSCILQTDFSEIIRLLSLLKSFGTVLYGGCLSSPGLEEIFSCKVLKCKSRTRAASLHALHMKRHECLAALDAAHDSLAKLKLPSSSSGHSIKEFCLQSASVVFCTVSDSFELHYLEMEPIDVLVIDEAFQLKECESVIPFQLPQLSHVVLVGDERQLPATTESKVSGEAGFCRSLFKRLSSLGHFTHLLNMQYRMHPSISLFPNHKFYAGQIKDGPNVESSSYLKCYLPLPMFSSYSFLNIADGREECKDGGTSWRNLVEVAVVLKILNNLHKAWNISKEELSVGVISPYAAQVGAIRERIPKKYVCDGRFTLKVQTVDGFQGGEMDIIIISSVRSNSVGSVGFLSNPHFTNVALTRARYCLWILGNDKTLIESKSEWASLVHDAMDRKCFFSADDDEDIGKAIFEVKKEYDQLEDLLNGSSSLFRNARWKVIFSENFRKAFRKLTSRRTKLSVMNMVLRLSCGWRPKRNNTDLICECSAQIVKQFKVEGLYVLCTVDIERKLNYVQVLKIWDVIPLEEIAKLIKRLDSIYETFSDDYISHCKEKSLDGELEVPKAWDATFDFVCRRNLTENSDDDLRIGATVDTATSYAENTKVTESLLLMKFYSLSLGIVNHLLSDHEGNEVELPFEVTEQEDEIIKCPWSTFILGRSGTGKTTVLTLKLFKREQEYHIATNGCDVQHQPTAEICERPNIEEIDEEANGRVLHQLFVTVSSKLCFAVKRHISQLKSFSCGEKVSAENSSDDVDFIGCIEQFRDIPDSFVGISDTAYPLAITFHKFLMMLDGTIGVSYFERFSELRDIGQGSSQSARSLALQTLVSIKEINYEKFCVAYWPHFNEKLSRKLDPSRVFTEIISHVKGGFQVDDCDGRLSRVDYVALSEGRASTLTSDEREKVYDIFLDYERMKAVNGEFDLSDLVNDLHSRLRSENFLGDRIDFVYIDEVQDLTLRQIALFKYICKNVDGGFVFSGDTAQTIARGIDFRFEDIRCLFYKEFLPESRFGTDYCREKGKLSKVFCLSQNFRTHAGVLKLSQSIIDLLCHYFPTLVDALSPETSLVCGESPILLESENDENAIISIFGNSSNISGNIVGFGAEQVILVRDECARAEVVKYVGKQALVLTILECKGLEFQDVLLYNFFGTSPLKSQWRIIYEYMNEQYLLDDKFPEAFPHFDQAKHNVLCSELKQLYVAITRTRQRLWICENMEGFSKPMFDYWKKLCLIEVRKVDKYLAETMKVASTPEEWKSQGYKLLKEANFEMAIMCFERAGYTHGERLANAYRLNAAADQIHVSDPDEACRFRRQAAEIFESIGMAESAAKCFYTLKEYERAAATFETIGKPEAAAECFHQLKEYDRAGSIYLEKCGASTLERAGECFVLAGRYNQAAEVYARGQFFSKCLSVCMKGKLFELGLQYIQRWRGHSYKLKGLKSNSLELTKIEDYLEGCARHYHEQGDNISMMIFVKALSSVDVVRRLLKDLVRLDELFSMEVELENFVEAANTAKMKGDHLLESYMFGKGGKFKDASICILWYVLFASLWVKGSHGWPLKQFKEKDFLLARAKSYSALVPDPFSEYVRLESTILLEKTSSLSELQDLMHASREIGSLRGEILCNWKILDTHLCTDSENYPVEDYLVFDLTVYSERKNSQNMVTVETLMHSWTVWRDKIVCGIQNLECLETQEINEDRPYVDFCLNFFGVSKHYPSNSEPLYLVLNPEAHWVRTAGITFLRREGKLILVDAHQFVSAARAYWGVELIKAGMKVLQILNRMYDAVAQHHYQGWYVFRCKLLIHVFEVSNFLLASNFLNLSQCEKSTLVDMLGSSSRKYFDATFRPDWWISYIGDRFYLKGMEISLCLLKGQFNFLGPKPKLAKGELMGRLLVTILSTGKLDHEFHAKISKCFEVYPHWVEFFERLIITQGKDTEIVQDSDQEATEDNVFPGFYDLLVGTKDGDSKHIFDQLLDRILATAAQDPEISQDTEEKIHPRLLLLARFCKALNTIKWESIQDYMSPVCFLYLLDRLMLVTCCCNGIWYVTAIRSTLAEWLNSQNENITKLETTFPGAKEHLNPAVAYIHDVVERLLLDPNQAKKWIVKSGIKESEKYLGQFLLRLVQIISVLYLNFHIGKDILKKLLQNKKICKKLPSKFVKALTLKSMKCPAVYDFLVAFRVICDPLVIIRTAKYPKPMRFDGPDHIFVDMSVNIRKEDIMQTLFLDRTKVSTSQELVPATEDTIASNYSREVQPSSSKTSAAVDSYYVPPQFVGLVPREEDSSEKVVKAVMKLWWVLDNALKIEGLNYVAEGIKIKEDLDKCLFSFNIAFTAYIWEAKGRFLGGEGVPNILRRNLAGTIDDFKRLSATLLDIMEPKSAEKLSTAKEIVKRLQCRRSMVEPFLDHMFAEPAAANEMVEAEEKEMVKGKDVSSSSSKVPIDDWSESVNKIQGNGGKSNKGSKKKKNMKKKGGR